MSRILVAGYHDINKPRAEAFGWLQISIAFRRRFRYAILGNDHVRMRNSFRVYYLNKIRACARTPRVELNDLPL